MRRSVVVVAAAGVATAALIPSGRTVPRVPLVTQERLAAEVFADAAAAECFAAGVTDQQVSMEEIEPLFGGGWPDPDAELRPGVLAVVSDVALDCLSIDDSEAQVALGELAGSPDGSTGAGASGADGSSMSDGSGGAQTAAGLVDGLVPAFDPTRHVSVNEDGGAELVGLEIAIEVFDDVVPVRVTNR